VLLMRVVPALETRSGHTLLQSWFRVPGSPSRPRWMRDPVVAPELDRRGRCTVGKTHHARFFVLATSRGRSVAGRANRRPVSDDDPDFQRLIFVQVKKESLIWVAPRDVGDPAAKFRSQGPRETPDAEHVLQARWDRALPALSAPANFVFQNYQMAVGQAAFIGRSQSNGCAYGDSPVSFPIQRMPNISLQPNPKPTSLDDLIAGVEDGIYSWRWQLQHRLATIQFPVQRTTVLRDQERQTRKHASRHRVGGRVNRFTN